MSRKLLMNTELEPAYDPYNIDGMKVLTRGKDVEWDGETFPIVDNPNSWATVDPVTVVSGRQYRITADGIWCWVVSYDDNDNAVSTLVNGSGDNPQDFTFTPDTNHIRFGIYDPNGQLTYCTVKAVK